MPQRAQERAQTPVPETERAQTQLAALLFSTKPEVGWDLQDLS
jgi:hypothetical protein